MKAAGMGRDAAIQRAPEIQQETGVGVL